MLVELQYLQVLNLQKYEFGTIIIVFNLVLISVLQ